MLLGRTVSPKPKAPALQSQVFAGAGHAILRTQGPAGLTAAFTFGPYGGFHGHFDKLSFVFFGHGQELGVDPGRAEGITGFKKVTDRVEFYRRQANAHAWSSAIVSAASLAISFSSPACKLFELKPLRNPMQHELVTNPILHEAGWLYPPMNEPGLGIDIVDEVVDRFRQ